MLRATFVLRAIKSCVIAEYRTYSSMALNEAGKKAAAIAAVEDWVTGDMSVGIGSGSTIIYAVKRIAEKVNQHNWNIQCVPTSFQAKELIKENNLKLTDLETTPVLDVVIDGADEVDSCLTCIKGGGGCLTQEKIVAACTKNLVIIADNRKNAHSLGDSWSRGIPVEVVPMAYVPIKKRIEEELGGEAVLRIAEQKFGPLVTDNGNFILDWKFQKEREWDWDTVNWRITMMPGVVETGLFINMACKAYFGTPDGQVIMRELPTHNDVCGRR